MKFKSTYLNFSLLLILFSFNSQAQTLSKSKTFDNTVYGVDIFPDGTKVVAACKDSTATIWNLRTDTSVKLIGHNNSVSSVNYNLKNNSVLTGAYDNTAILWDVEGRESTRLIGHSDGIINVTQSDALLGTASRDKTARVWDRKGKLKFTLEHTDQVNVIEFVPQKAWIISASFDGFVKFWNYKGELINSCQPHTSGVKSIAIDIDKEVVITGHKDGKISIIDFTGNVLKSINAHNKTIAEIIIKEDSFISAGMDGQIKTWSYAGLLQDEIKAHDSYISDIALTNNILVSSSGDKTVKVWKILQGPDRIPAAVIEFFGFSDQSVKRNEKAPEETAQFGQLAGIWYCDGFMPDPQGKEDNVPFKAYWAWKYILDGYGVQDYFYQGKNEFRYWDYFKRGMSLTQLRVYDTMEGLWKIAFITDNGGKMPGKFFGTFTAKMEGEELIMEPSLQNSDNMSRIIFYGFAKDSFEWRAETSSNAGETWTTTTRLSARRLK